MSDTTNTTGMVEMMFTDATYNAAHGAIQGRVVPGMLAYTIVEGLLVQATMQHTGLALLETAIKVHGPTFVGDTIHGEVEITGEEAPTAWLSDASKGHALFGEPRTGLEQMIDWVAEWLERGGETLGKPTHFESRNGKY